MIEPEVRYCTTADGVRIAYTVSGAGRPLLFCMEPTTSHVQLEWSHPALGTVLRGLAQNNTVIRYDHRGYGLSDRLIAETLDEWVLDIEAVAQRAGFPELALFGMQLATPAAIAFGARHPERISRFVVADGFARWGDFLALPQVQAIQGAARLDFNVATEAIGFAAFGAGREESREHGKYIRACVNQEQFVSYDTYGAWDASDLAGSIGAPTLVLRHSGIEYVTLEMAKDLASRIPNAQLTVLEGGWADHLEEFGQLVRKFIGAGAERATASAELPSGMTAILFADIADSTALTERLGDASFRQKAKALEGALRSVIRDNAGTPIEGKLLGDGVLAVFTSARQAIQAALTCGRLLVSETVRSLARTSAGVTFEDRGEQSLKGVGEPVRVWVVREGE